MAESQAGPDIESVKKILVVGSGAMGSQIGMVCAISGYDATVQDIDEDMLDKARKQLESRMSRNVEKGRMEQDEVDEAFETAGLHYRPRKRGY